jgi:hypothetical protein
MDGWIELFGALVELIPAILEKKRDAQAHIERTLQAFNEAYYETESYFGMLEDGGEPSRERQFQVARCWDDVSHMIARYDENLANRLSLKSRFWREGAAWSPQQRQQAKIGLEQVRRDGRLLLMPMHRAK